MFKKCFNHAWCVLLVKWSDPVFNQTLERKEKERTRGQVWWPILRICTLHLTHPSTHTHTAVSSEQTHTHTHTHTCKAVGSHLCWVRCLAQGSHLVVLMVDSTGHWLPPPTIPAGPETRTRNLWVTSLTLCPLCHDCPPLNNSYASVDVVVA